MIRTSSTAFAIACFALSLAACGKSTANRDDPGQVALRPSASPDAEKDVEGQTGEAAIPEADSNDADAPTDRDAEPADGETIRETEPTSESDSSEPASDAEDRADDPSDAAGVDAVASAEVDAGSPPAPSRERFLLMAPGGPLVVDLILKIDGRPFDQPLDQLVEEALESADTDGDGIPTWDEIVQSPAFQSGLFGNLSFETDEQREQLKRMYDRNQDGTVDRDELPRFVTRNAGGSKPFSLRSSNLYRSSNRSRSPTRLLLDEDHDGSITRSEMNAAPMRLRMRDANDDRVLLPNDFSASAMQATGQMLNRSRIAEPDTAVLLGEDPNWGDIAFRLEESYAFVGEGLAASDWPLAEELFSRLDADSNERLSNAELKPLAEIEPDLLIAANFGQMPGNESGADASPLQLLEVSPAWEAQMTDMKTNDVRMSINLPNLEVEFLVNEDPALLDPSGIVEAQFGMYDIDENGYLEEDEFPAQRPPGFDIEFAEADANEDGMLFPEEVTFALMLRQRANASQIRARVADQQDALFTALDQDADGRLTDREIEASPQVLAQLDRNGDGELQSHEIPGSMIVAIVRGDPRRDNSLLQVQPPRAVASSDAVRWFGGMDANSDGEISRREFLGTGEQFDRLDGNHDGYLDAEEASPTVSESE